MEAAKNLTASDILHKIEENFVFEEENLFVEIHCAHIEPRHDMLLPVALPSFTQFDELKYRVFTDLWRNKFVTPGATFGADFLLYPGDPLIYHASHIVIVLNQTPKLQLLQLVTKARLAVITNKIFVLAYVGIDNAINYQTIEWDGNIEKDDFIS